MRLVPKHPLLLGSASLIIASAVLYGCNDFLSNAANPQGTLNSQSLANAAGVEGSLIAAYRALEWNNGVGGAWGNAASNWVWGSVASDDAYKGSEASDQPPINDIEAYHWSTADAESYLIDKWRGAYEGVVRANATLRLLKEVTTSNAGALSTADVNGITGEALFLRAHYHFEAYRMWGNIPYYKEDDTDFRKANGDTTAALTAILADLDSAIKVLPTTARKGQVGRATQWTAKAYKGRVQVYKASSTKAAADWTAARTTLLDVRTNGPFALETSFDRVWGALNQNGTETILAYQASANDGEPSGNNSNYGERLNFPHSGSPFGCCGFHQPAQNLVNFYKVDAAGLPLSISAPTTWNTQNTVFDATAANIAQAVDPRLDWTVGRDGVPFKDWGTHAAGWIRAPAYGGRYSPKKNIDEKAANAESSVGWVPTQLNNVNIHIFRYADALLMLAEADVETNDLPGALAIVNQVRTRAGVRAQGCGYRSDIANDKVETKWPQCLNDARMAVPLNDASITWATYRVSNYGAFASQAVAREAVRTERRLELGMEGQRFFDLRRYGTAATELNAYLNGVGGGNEKARQAYLPAAEAFAAKHRWYPIPPIQIELSKVGGQNRLVQNPGW